MTTPNDWLFETDEPTPTRVVLHGCLRGLSPHCLCLKCANWQVLPQCGVYRCIKCAWRGPVSEENCLHEYKPIH